MKNLYTIPFLAALTISANLVQAEDYTWTGNVDTDWKTAGNWSPEAVPNLEIAGSNAVVSGETIYEAPGDFHLNNGNSLTINNGGSWIQTNDISWLQFTGGILNVNSGGSFDTGTSANIFMGTGTTFNIAGVFNTHGIAMSLGNGISMYLNAGTVFTNTAGNFVVNDADATFHLTGGTATIGEFNALAGDIVISGGVLNTSIVAFNDPGLSSSFDLMGGRINVAPNAFQGIYAMGNDDYVNFTIGSTGEFFVDGLDEAGAQTLITDGRLRYDNAIGNIDYTAQDGGYLFTVSGIPEPSTYAALVGVLALVAAWQSRHHK